MRIDKYDTIQVELSGKNEGTFYRGFFLKKKESNWNSYITTYRMTIFVGKEINRHIGFYVKKNNIVPCRIVLFEKDLFKWEKTEERIKWLDFLKHIKAYTDTL